ncbi:hypothetical protein PHLGIDRAFT_80764, partial [Phlebiopsis gigantea 11061_1 CR5-6]
MKERPHHERIRQTLPSSPFAPTLLRNADDVTYIGREFFLRKQGREQVSLFMIEGELVSLPFTEYRAARIPTPRHRKERLSFEDIPPLGDTVEARRTIPCIGHEHRRPDADSPELWEELAEYLRCGTIPNRLTNETSARRHFEARAQAYMHRDNRLWKVNPHALPRLVVVDRERRKALVAEAHLVCGHRGRDATYM